jgi:ABC-2 type transport system permease protein
MSQTLTLTRTESKLFLREWTGIFFVFGIPIGLLTIFSLTSTGDGSDASAHIPARFLPTMATGIGISMLGMATLPMVLANYRDKGVLRRMSTTPVQPVKLLVAQLLVHLAAAVVVIALILAVGRLAFDAELPASGARFALAAALFCVSQFSIGLLVAAIASSGKSASIIGNILIFPSMFFAGIWTPGDLMPESLRWLRDITPMGAGMSGMQDAWAGAWPGLEHTVAMIAVTALCVGLAARLFRWE